MTNCNAQIWVSSISGVLKPYNPYINTLIVLRLLQGACNHLTRLQQGIKVTNHCFFNLVATLYQQGDYSQAFLFGMLHKHSINSENGAQCTVS